MNAPEQRSKVKIENSLEFDNRIEFNHLRSGCRSWTIRKGHRYFAQRITIASYPAIVNGFKHYTLLTVPLEILVKKGYKSIFDAVRSLQVYYPDMNLNTPVTVVEFRMDVVDGGSTHRV